ncbi:hypothetical protein Tco_1558515 [Tanacetum coccineum]
MRLEIVEGSNAPNETGNVQRTLRTSSSGNTSIVQCYNCSDIMLGIIQSQEFGTRNTSWNKCCWQNRMKLDYDSAFISEVQSSSNNKNEEQMYPTHTKNINSTIDDDQIDSDIIFDSPNGNVNIGIIEKDTHVPDLCA